MQSHLHSYRVMDYPHDEKKLVWLPKAEVSCSLMILLLFGRLALTFSIHPTQPLTPLHYAFPPALTKAALKPLACDSSLESWSVCLNTETSVCAYSHEHTHECASGQHSNLPLWEWDTVWWGVYRSCRADTWTTFKRKKLLWSDKLD